MLSKEKICDELDDKIWDIQIAVDELTELKREIESNIIKNKNNKIHNVDKFKRELCSAGLYNKEMEEFLISYLQYSNCIEES